jgi:dipeptidyl aminopeptidase/acylaminoacyl peptidase
MFVSNKVSLELFLKPYSISAFSISDDESYLVVGTNTTGAFNLWKMDIQDTGLLTKLTSHNQKIDSIAIKNNKIYFTSDKNGNENMHIYCIDQNGLEWKDVRTEPACRYFFGGVSEDGSKLYYTSTKDNPIYLSLFLYDLETNKEELLHHGNGAETQLMSVSPNGKDIAYFVRYNHSNMKIYVKKNGQDIELIQQANQHYRTSDLCFMNEDKVIFTTNYQQEFTYLASYEFSTGSFQKLLDIDNQDIEKIQYLSTTGEIYLQTKAGPIDRLYVYNLETTQLKDLQVPTYTIQHFQISNKGTLYMTGSSSMKPTSLYQKETMGDWLPLFKNQVPTLSEEELIQPERIRYRSFDGVEIEAMFYQAKEASSNGHTIVYPHGGPQYNEQIDYYGFFQYLLHCGFNILAPNFRGTPNYGTSFLQMIEGDWGGGPRLDILSGIDALVQQGKVESDKIIMFGMSYGGYMSLLLFGRHPERFKACIDVCGPTNLFTLIETCPDHWKERMDSWIGNPIKDRERLIEQSPITYVKNMEKPLLIIQGANDPRVKRSESDQMVEALKNSGVAVEYMVFEDEGHGFAKKENELKAYQAISDFLENIVGKK